MDEENFQLTNDSAGSQRVEKVKGIGLGNAVTLEMFSGVKYKGHVSGYYFGEKTRNGKKRVGGYIILDTGDGRFRLDALDIKLWQ